MWINQVPLTVPVNCYWKFVFNGHKQIWWVSVEKTMICISLQINDYKCTVGVLKQYKNQMRGQMLAKGQRGTKRRGFCCHVRLNWCKTSGFCAYFVKPPSHYLLLDVVEGGKSMRHNVMFQTHSFREKFLAAFPSPHPSYRQLYNTEPFFPEPPLSTTPALH